MISMHKWGKNPTEQSSAYSNWLRNTSIRQDLAPISDKASFSGSVILPYHDYISE